MFSWVAPRDPGENNRMSGWEGGKSVDVIDSGWEKEAPEMCK